MNVKVDVSNLILKTQRLVLRPFGDNDLQDFFEYASQEGVGESAGWLHHQNINVTKEVLRDFIASKRQLAIVLDGKVIGSMGLEKYSPIIYPTLNMKRAVELGFVLSKDYWHQGLMTEAMGVVINYLFKEIKLDMICVSHFEDNYRCEGLVKKYSFSPYGRGIYPDTDRMACFYILKNPDKNNLLEVCCGSLADAYSAYRGGASRIELNSALYLGGLTPNSSLVKELKENTNLKVISMVRPRGCGFCYREIEIKEMFLAARDLLESGSDGLAFGFLNSDKTIDTLNTKKMIDLIHSYNKEAVFHRAIDVCADYFKGVEELISLGVDRILTSGTKAKAADAITIIRELNLKYGDRIEIVVGSGVNAHNALEILNETGVYQIHSSCKTLLDDDTSRKNEVDYSYQGLNKYESVSENNVKELLKLIK